MVIIPQHIHVSVDQDKDEWDQKNKDEPEVNHLHVGSGGEALRDGKEHRADHKDDGQVDGDDSFKEEGLQVVSCL